MAKNKHVVPKNGKWAVQTEGTSRASSVYDTKREAIDSARTAARSGNIRILVHGKNGQILRSAAAPSTLNEDKLREAIRRQSSKPGRIK